MRARIGPLLAELHAHTTWSDGAFSIGQLVDIYGMRGFDVLPALTPPRLLTRLDVEPRKLAA